MMMLMMVTAIDDDDRDHKPLTATFLLRRVYYMLCEVVTASALVL